MYLDNIDQANSSSMTFKQIIDLYNANFQMLRNFMLTIGDKIISERFTGSTDTLITLSSAYTPTNHNLVVYKNGSRQWLSEGYNEVSSTSIRLLEPRLVTDEIRVEIIQSNLLQMDIQSYIEDLQELAEDSQSNLIESRSISNQLLLLNSDLTDKLAQFLETKFSMEDILTQVTGYYQTLTSLYNTVLQVQASIQSMNTATETNSQNALAYLNEIRQIKSDIEDMGLLTPEQVNGTEVPLARGGYPTLRDRLEKYSYTFNNVSEMTSNLHLSDGDICFTMGGTLFNDGNQGVYKVVELANTDTIAAETYYELQSPPADDTKHLYAYKIGGFGYGGGGGTGGTSETVTFTVEDLDPTIFLEEGDSLNIRYLYRSGIKTGSLKYSTDGYTYQTQEIDGPGYHTLQLGPFNRQGNYTLRMYAIDSSGLMSDPLSFNLKVGDLSVNIITSITNYLSTDSITLRWRISDIYGLPITSHVSIKKNGQTVASYDIDNSIVGVNSKNIGSLSAGYYTAEISASNSSTTSDVKTLALYVSSSSELATYFLAGPSAYLDSDTIYIGYGVLFSGNTRFTTQCYINDELITTLDSEVGQSNNWAVGSISAGSKTLKLVTTTTGGLTNTIEKTILVTESISTSMTPVSDNLVLNFDSRTKMNGDASTREHWGPNDVCTLKNFDFSSNGWISENVDREDSQSIVLKCNGFDNYAEINYCPFCIDDLDLATGMTLEMKVKGYDLGNPDATVMECLNEDNKGFIITNSKIRFNPFGSVYGNDAISINLSSDEWLKISLVVHKYVSTSADENDYSHYTTNDLAIVYINGTICGVIEGDIDTNYYMSNRYKMYIGAHYDQSLSYTTNYAKCEIQHIRVYNDALTHLEILNNFISDIHNTETQALLQVLNDYSSGEPGTAAVLQLPTLYISGGDLSALDAIEGTPSKDYLYPNVDITFTDSSGNSNNFSKYGCNLKVQGTSSTNYLVKNYKITIYNYDSPQDTTAIVKNKSTGEFLTNNDLSPTGMYLSSAIKKQGKKFKVSPKDSWLPEDTFTLKADYMESSHAHNVGTASSWRLTSSQLYLLRELMMRTLIIRVEIILRLEMLLMDSQ